MTYPAACEALLSGHVLTRRYDPSAQYRCHGPFVEQRTRKGGSNRPMGEWESPVWLTQTMLRATDWEIYKES